MATLNWLNALQIEQHFFSCLVDMKKTGFLIDQEKLTEHLITLNKEIEEIDLHVMPQLPLRLQVNEQKVKGEYKYLKKLYMKGTGALCANVGKWADDAGVDHDDVWGMFSRISYVEMDLGSGAQIKEYLLSCGWYPAEWNYSKITKERTSPKMSQTDPFLGVEGDIGKKVARRMILIHRRSLLEGLKRIIRTDGRITAGVTGIAATGRLKHTGIVNIPGCRSIFGKECREIFTAKKGYSIVGCDASSCQLRMLCHYMGDKDYTEAVVAGNSEDGTDVHTRNLEYSKMSSYRSDADRDDSKKLIYSFLFGAADARLGVDLRVSKRQAGQIRANLLKGLPKLDLLIKAVTQSWKKNKYLIGLDGRKILPRAEHMVLVYLLQGAEAILMKIATIYACKWIAARGLDAHMVAHVHDEFQWEVKDEECEEVGELLKKSIVKAGEWLKLDVPMDGDYKIGKSWKETH